MKETFLNKSNSFRKIMNLIKYLDEGAAILLGLLYNISPLNEHQLFEKKYYEETLLGIREHLNQLKNEWMNAASESQKFMMNIPDFYDDYENIKREMDVIREMISNILDTEFYVNSEGMLIDIKSRE